MNTAIYLLRCTELGIQIRDLDFLTMGEIYDMLIERQNDEFKYPYKATQADFDKF